MQDGQGLYSPTFCSQCVAPPELFTIGMLLEDAD